MAKYEKLLWAVAYLFALAGGLLLLAPTVAAQYVPASLLGIGTSMLAGLAVLGISITGLSKVKLNQLF